MAATAPVAVEQTSDGRLVCRCAECRMAQYARLPACLRCKGHVELVPTTLPITEAPPPDPYHLLSVMTMRELLLHLADGAFPWNDLPPVDLDGPVTLARLLRCLPTLPTIKTCTAALVEEALRREEGKLGAARALGIGKTTLYRKLHDTASGEARV